MRKPLTYLITLLGLLSVLNAKFVQAETILSKQDAATMFSLSFQEWEQSVLAADAAGFAKYDSMAPLEVTMIADVPFGRIITTPGYRDAGSLPWKLMVSIIFSPEASAIFLSQSRQEHKALVQQIFTEMRPDYTVLTELILPRPDGLVMKNYQIFRYGDFPPLDLSGEKFQGCWKDCLKYGSPQ